jgi:hypothetical protein
MSVVDRPLVRRAIGLGRTVMTRLDTRRTFAVAFVVIVAFGVLGALDYNGVPLGHAFFLDGEGNPPAAFSALLLVAAGVACCYVAAEVARDVWRRWVVLGAFFVFMSFDEALTVHERLSLLTDIAWQKLYLPVFAIAFLMALACLASLRDVLPGVALLMGGGACWFVAQVLEKLEANKYDGQVEHYWIYATVEEVLEMTGSLLFLLAAVAVYQTRTARAVSAGVVSQSDLPGDAHAPRVDDELAKLDGIQG